MDFSQVSFALKLSLSSLEEDRTKALHYINQVRVLPFYGPTLLKISSDENLTLDIKQNAAIQLKNYVLKFWKYGENQEINKQLKFNDDEIIILISNDDKHLIRTNILVILTHCNFKPILKVYHQIIKKIIRYDFPDRWSEFIPTVIEMIRSNEEKKVFSGVNSILLLAKSNEYEVENAKTAYHNTLRLIQEDIENLMQTILGNLKIEFAAIIVKKLLKIYNCSIQLSMPKFYMDINSLSKWFNYFKIIINSSLEKDLETKTENSEEIEKMTKNVYWKIKYQCFNIIYRIYQKYGIESNTEKSLLQFSKIINDHFGPIILELSLNTLFKTTSNFVAHNVIALIFKFFNLLPQRNQLMDTLEKHLESILKNHIIQETLVTKKDIELWEQNPKNYIYKKLDISENFFIKRYNATQFVKSICCYKKKNESGLKYPAFFNVFYKYLIDILKIYEEQKIKGPTPDQRIKEAIFEILHTIAEQIQNYAPETIEELLRSFVIKEFDSEVGMLRERACEVCQSFSVNFIKNSDLFKYIVEKICKSIQDKDLPVRIISASGIPLLLKRDDGKILLKPFIKDILSFYMKLMDDIDLDELVNGLGEIVYDFKDDISEFSISLVSQLVSSFHRLIKIDVDDDDGEAQIAASGCIKTIIKIMDVNTKNVEIYGKIEQGIESILQFGLRSEGFEILEDTVILLCHLTSKSNVISTNCWNYLSVLVDLVVGLDEELKTYNESNKSYTDFQGIGFEMLGRISIILMNFIIRVPDKFLTGVDCKGRSFLMRVMYMIERVIWIGTKKREELDNCHAIKIIIVLFESCKERLDNFVDSLFKFVIDNLKIAKSTYYKVNLIQAVCSIFLYNPLKIMNILESLDQTQYLFEQWVSLNKKMTFESEFKRSLIGLASVLLIPPEKLNQKIKANIGIFIKQIVMLCSQITDIKEEVKFVEETVIDSENEDEEENLNKIKQILEESHKKAEDMEKQESYILDDNDEDIDDTEYKQDYKDLWKTEIERKCEFLYLKEMLNYLFCTNMNWYNEIIGNLTEEEKNLLKLSIEKAEKRKEK